MTVCTDVLVQFFTRLRFADCGLALKRLTDSLEHVVSFEVASVCVVVDRNCRVQVDSDIALKPSIELKERIL